MKTTKIDEFKKVLGYILAESDIKEDEVKTDVLGSTVRENTRTYRVHDDEYTDFYVKIVMGDPKRAKRELLAVTEVYGPTSDPCMTIYRVSDGYIYDQIPIQYSDR